MLPSPLLLRSKHFPPNKSSSLECAARAHSRDFFAHILTAAPAYRPPHYRHITLNGYTQQTPSHRYFSVSFRNIQAAFAHFLRVYNQGRPFILASFSQGGKSVVELLKRLTPAERQRLVAAYVLGHKVTPDDVKQAPWTRPVQDSTDTGVTICYNTVSSIPYIKPICKRSQCHVYQSSQLAFRLHLCTSSRRPHRHARPNSPSTCSPRL
ncbi:MAG: DUF3089 domain-containing protein [Prevotellamassilia sp.]